MVIVIVIVVVILLIPAFPAEVALYLPNWFRMVKKQSELAAADCAKVHFFNIVRILFLIAGFAQKRT